MRFPFAPPPECVPASQLELLGLAPAHLDWGNGGYKTWWFSTFWPLRIFRHSIHPGFPHFREEFCSVHLLHGLPHPHAPPGDVTDRCSETTAQRFKEDHPQRSQAAEEDYHRRAGCPAGRQRRWIPTPPFFWSYLGSSLLRLGLSFLHHSTPAGRSWWSPKPEQKTNIHFSFRSEVCVRNYILTFIRSTASLASLSKKSGGKSLSGGRERPYPRGSQPTTVKRSLFRDFSWGPKSLRQLPAAEACG